MNKEQANKIVEKYLKSIFSFAIKRCKSFDDAKDLTQDITLKLFRILLIKDDILDYDKYVWTIARNEITNYYRKTSRYLGVCIDNVVDDSPINLENDLVMKETIDRLYDEIAYLSKMQRSVLIAYYYENMRLNDIAEKLGISLSLVKWHLFDAKRNLKRRMEKMTNNDTLKFNPIEFSIMGFNGSAGTMGGTQAFFRSILSQNIAYSVYREAKTVNEIAYGLGVSPVFVESEIEFLTEYGYLIKNGNKYLANILIEELDGKGEKILILHEQLYSKVAKIVANELFERIEESKVLNSDKIKCCYFQDKNYLMWAIIPYILANCDNDIKEKIKFDEVATIRPDGAHDIANASIKSDKNIHRKYYSSLLKWCGPSWTGDEKRTLWCCRSEWSKDKTMQELWEYVSPKSIRLLSRLMDDENLSIDELTFLAKEGFIMMENGDVKIKIVCLKDNEIKNDLLKIGRDLKNKYNNKFEELKRPFIKAVLEFTPKHLRKTQEYGLQYMFRSDGWFLIYCIKELINNSKLKLPIDEQRSSLMTLLCTK